MFITGGSASGKSEYAGKVAEKLFETAMEKCRLRQEDRAAGKILYIATLSDESPESKQKVARHRELRKNGPYDVAECFSLKDLKDLTIGNTKKVGHGRNPRNDRFYEVVLFDSLDGFTANVFFGCEEERRPDTNTLAEQTARRILTLNSLADNLIVVSDAFYSDGTVYRDVLEDYIRYTAASEQLLAEAADLVTEVICGIPLLLKGEMNEFF